MVITGVRTWNGRNPCALCGKSGGNLGPNNTILVRWITERDSLFLQTESKKSPVLNSEERSWGILNSLVRWWALQSSVVCELKRELVVMVGSLEGEATRDREH
ncbi:hypothetical protein AALP_AA5G292300 [Arabis alpina]|uniref:Uncharacterized protein n=1 Tax=Arabis alpina TaxID=50452 RepID=A0A087H045_ARAAL|nr:hypothetical protein AALP_AA5G292300 [Arabis alpina]